MSNDTTNPDDSIEDELTALRQNQQGLIQNLQNAMGRITELEDELSRYEQERERLVFRVGKLEAILPDESDPYDDLSREERVMRVQNYVMERAWASNGRFKIDYNDVLWSVFDGEPSVGYCYKLMRLAGQEDGFSYDDTANQLRVDLDRVNGDGVLSRVNKAESGGGH